MKLIIGIALFVSVHALPPLHPLIRYQSEDGAPPTILRHWEPTPDFGVRQTPNQNVIGLNNLHQILVQLANKINSDSSNHENEGRPPQHILNYLKIIHELLNNKNGQNDDDGVLLTPINSEDNEAITPINDGPNDESDLVTPIDHGLNNGLDHVTPINNGPSYAPELATPINDGSRDGGSENLPIDTDDIEIIVPIDTEENGPENGAPVNEGVNEGEVVAPVNDISEIDVRAANDELDGHQDTINDGSIDIIYPDAQQLYLQNGNGNTENGRRLVDFMPRPI